MRCCGVYGDACRRDSAVAGARRYASSYVAITRRLMLRRDATRADIARDSAPLRHDAATDAHIRHALRIIIRAPR